MGTRNFPNWLKAYRTYTEISESPDQFHFWTGASVIAGALRRRVWLEEHHFQWTPNLYIILVAPPGVATKSTTINIGINHILGAVDGIKLGPSSLTPQGLILALQEAKEVVEFDFDVHIPMACITCGISELGTFLKPNDTELIDFLTDLWDGSLRGNWRHKTKTQGQSDVPNPWINLIGCTTPSWLRYNFPMHLVEGGLTSRILFIYAENKRRLIAYPSDHIDSKSHMAQKIKLIEDLVTISQMQGQYELTPEARAWGNEWYKQHWDKKQSEVHERLPAYAVRKQTHIHKLAMILAAAQRNDLVITLEDLTAAHRIVTSLEPAMEKIFQIAGIQTPGRSSVDVLAIIVSHGGITRSDLMRSFVGKMDHKQLELILESLVQSNYIQRTVLSSASSTVPTLGYVPTRLALLQGTGPESSDTLRQES